MVFAVFPEVTPCDSDKIQLLGYRTKKMALAQLVREWLIISALLKLWTIQAQILGMASEPTPMSRLIHPMPRVIWVERRCSAIIMFAWLFNLDFCSFWNWSYIDCRLLEFEPYNSFFLLNVRLFAFEELRTVTIFYIWNPNIYIYIYIYVPFFWNLSCMRIASFWSLGCTHLLPSRSLSRILYTYTVFFWKFELNKFVSFSNLSRILYTFLPLKFELHTLVYLWFWSCVYFFAFEIWAILCASFFVQKKFELYKILS